MQNDDPQIRTVFGSPYVAHEVRRIRVKAFTFIEVLFAIVILGVGMIMIAGILPVAIKQNSDTRDELFGRAIAEAGVSYVRAAYQQNPNAFPPTLPGTVATADPRPDANLAISQTVGRVLPLNFDTVATNGALQLLPGLQGSRICSADAPFQWLAFYRRDVNAKSLQLIVMSMRLHNTDPVDRYSVSLGKSTLDHEVFNRGNGPFEVRFHIEEGGVTDPDRIVFTGTAPDTDDFDTRVAAPGAFIIVGSSPGTITDPDRPYRNNGRIFRLGNRRDDLDATKGGRVWELASSYDLATAAAGPDGIVGTPDDIADISMGSVADEATGWMVGRGRSNPSAGDDILEFNGLPQDLVILKTDIPVQ